MSKTIAQSAQELADSLGICLFYTDTEILQNRKAGSVEVRPTEPKHKTPMIHGLGDQLREPPSEA